MRFHLLLIFILASTTHADISLPLAPYYRPGRYLPVHLDQTQRTRLHATGAVDVEGPGPILPWLVFDPPRTVTLRNSAGETSQNLPALQPLAPNESLILTTLDPATLDDLAKKLCPGQTAIWLRLDPAAILTGPAAAWQTADAMVLDESFAERLPPDTISSLISGGTALAIRGHIGGSWPARPFRDFQILSSARVGPGAFSEEAYDTVAGWSPGWPAALRIRILLWGTLFAIAALGCLLLPRKWALIGIGSAAIIATAALLGWWRFQSPVAQRSGEICLVGSELSLHDRWIDQLSATRTNAKMIWSDLTIPVFYSKQMPDKFEMCLQCADDGRPASFDYTLPADIPLVFLSRRVAGPEPLPPLHQPVLSPLKPVVDAYYLKNGHTLLGETQSPPIEEGQMRDIRQWPDIYIQAAK